LDDSYFLRAEEGASQPRHKRVRNAASCSKQKVVAAGPVSRILSAGCPAGRSFLWDAHCCAPQATYPEVVTRRAGTCPGRTRVPPYLVLLRVGFALPAALLRRRCALTAPFHPYPGVTVEAVYFLWHFPSDELELALPDVIRHTALRSSDFPPASSEDDASDRPVRLPTLFIIFDGLLVQGVGSRVSGLCWP
jgi:hypothetical protein